ncbi:hypothetical protein A3N67_17955 [Enterobacter hormaechei subsp. steigerwaltii]|nr:hypothetical protein A3N67_17955 [Enterobacter hormaechei subsp. steigerwaltii]
MSRFPGEAARSGRYNERVPQHTAKGRIGITIVKNTQIINN